MELISNTTKTLRDDLAVEIKEGSRLSVAAACFSIFTLFEDLGFMSYSCNYKICKECCCDKNPCPDACSDVIESIALIETSLSHILNAEGEKIQRVLAETDDINKIMCVGNQNKKTDA